MRAPFLFLQLQPAVPTGSPDDSPGLSWGATGEQDGGIRTMGEKKFFNKPKGAIYV